MCLLSRSVFRGATDIGGRVLGAQIALGLLAVSLAYTIPDRGLVISVFRYPNVKKYM